MIRGKRNKVGEKYWKKLRPSELSGKEIFMKRAKKQKKRWKYLMTSFLIVGVLLTGCGGKRVKLISEKLPRTRLLRKCSNLVNDYHSNFRVPTPAHYAKILNCFKFLEKEAVKSSNAEPSEPGVYFPAVYVKRFPVDTLAL